MCSCSSPMNERLTAEGHRKSADGQTALDEFLSLLDPSATGDDLRDQVVRVDAAPERCRWALGGAVHGAPCVELEEQPATASEHRLREQPQVRHAVRVERVEQVARVDGRAGLGE